MHASDLYFEHPNFQDLYVSKKKEDASAYPVDGNCT